VRLRLEEHARARPYEVLVEHPLVEAALPPLPVQGVQGVPARLHPREAVAVLSGRPALHEPLEGVAGLALGNRGPRPVELELVKRLVELLVRQGGGRVFHAVLSFFHQ
jgi:hypothetical protein